MKPGEEAAQQALGLQTRALDIVFRLREGNPQPAFHGRTAAMSLFLASQRAQAAGDQELATRCRKLLRELITVDIQRDPQVT